MTLDELLRLNKVYFENICKNCSESYSLCQQCQYNLDSKIKEKNNGSN